MRKLKWTPKNIEKVLFTKPSAKNASILTKKLDRSTGAINIIKRKAQMIIEGKKTWENDTQLQKIKELLKKRFAYFPWWADSKIWAQKHKK